MRLIATAAVFMLPTFAFAETVSRTFDGLYVGGQVAGEGIIAKDHAKANFNGHVNVVDGTTDRNVFTYGVFGGFGQTLGGGLYLGAEIEASESDHHFFTTIDDPTGFFRQEFFAKSTYGGSIRLGTVIDNATLLYLRAGAVNTEFQYKCCATPTFIKSVDLSEREWGLRLGGGIETMIGGGFSLRTDYSYTWYDNWGLSDFAFSNQNPPGRQHSYDIVETLTRFGLAYHFGSGPDVVAATADFSGAYGGVSGTYSDFISGPLVAKDGETASAAYGEGIGLLGGYRFQFNRLVMGAEIDGGLHNATYDDNDGQHHEMNHNWGVSGQLGWVFGPTLVFGKVGGMWGEFETEITGGETASASDWQSGFSYGAGMETSLKRNLSLRLDWTRAEFASKDVIQSDGQILEMNPIVATSRAALIYRY